jgi:hypothetical protein
MTISPAVLQIHELPVSSTAVPVPSAENKRRVLRAPPCCLVFQKQGTRINLFSIRFCVRNYSVKIRHYFNTVFYWYK